MRWYLIQLSFSQLMQHEESHSRPQKVERRAESQMRVLISHSWPAIFGQVGYQLSFAGIWPQNCGSEAEDED